LRNVRDRGALLFRISRQILSTLADTETPQGIIALVSYHPSALDMIPEKDIPLLVVIDRIQDPGNLGTVIRTSDAAGADALIILPGTCDAYMPKVIRATAGSIFNIPLVYTDAASLTAHLRGKAIKLLVTDAHASESIYDADLSRPLALVFGNETEGASKKMKEQADALIKIPIFGRAESLNVALSAAIFLFEAVRQRKGRS
jgi:TrmH family RNA methyltransferase